jgi:hypothetical protein
MLKIVCYYNTLYVIRSIGRLPTADAWRNISVKMLDRDITATCTALGLSCSGPHVWEYTVSARIICAHFFYFGR